MIYSETPIFDYILIYLYTESKDQWSVQVYQWFDFFIFTKKFTIIINNSLRYAAHWVCYLHHIFSVLVIMKVFHVCNVCSADVTVWLLFIAAWSKYNILSSFLHY